MKYSAVLATLPDKDASRYHDLLLYTHNDDLRKQLLQSMHRRIRIVRSVANDGELVGPDLENLAITAIKLGWFRAVLNRFSAERNLDQAWWRARRREAGVRWDTRVEDFNIILREYPDFVEYVPDPPITKEELLEAARMEFRDQIAGPGSLYHERMCRRAAFSKRVCTPKGGKIRVPKLNTNAFEVGRAEETFNEFEFLTRKEEGQEYGPSVLRAAAVAKREYGWRASLIWLMYRLYFPGRITDLVRALGFNEKEIGSKKFDAIRRDLQRKLPKMDRELLEILRHDPELQDQYEVTFDTVFSVTEKTDSSTEIDLNAVRSRKVCQEELERYAVRWRRRMLEAAESDPVLKKHAAALRAEEEGRTDITYLLHRFIECELKGNRKEFRALVQKWCDLGTEIVQAVGA